MSLDEQLKQIYTKFYHQRGVLNEAPQLTQGPTNGAFDSQKADVELAKVISYLMGVPDIQKESFERAIEIIQKHYKIVNEIKKQLPKPSTRRFYSKKHRKKLKNEYCQNSKIILSYNRINCMKLVLEFGHKVIHKRKDYLIRGENDV